MSEWTKSEETDDEVWNHDDYGSIVKISDKYHALIPQTFVLGGFDNLEEAKRQVLLNYDVLLNLSRNFGPDMLRFIENLRIQEQK